ncbi:MAG: TraM recognition domain-containing protein [Clostridia bacterium]|nr:TraM recognition domain-containing protein [Clostridia bacterium]
MLGKHKLQLGYFRKHFYNEGTMRNDTERFVHSAITQLDGLLRIPGLRDVLCNRTNNINFDTALENGEVTIVCTRRGDLGSKMQKTFGLFFLLSMQRSVIKRPGSELSRIPHILYIDDSSEFICSSTLSMFTLYRKYKVGTIATVQNLEQLDTTVASRKTILSNCTAKIVFGNLTPEENEFWSKEFGDKRDWLYSQDMSFKGEGPGGQFWGGEGSVKDVSYGDMKGVKWGWKKNFELGKIQALKFKNCAYKYKDDKGKSFVGVAELKFMDSKYKELHKVKNFDFAKYQTGIVGENIKHRKRKNKFDPKRIDFDDFDGTADIEPIQTDVTDSGALFNSEDAIVYDINKKTNE